MNTHNTHTNTFSLSIPFCLMLFVRFVCFRNAKCVYGNFVFVWKRLYFMIWHEGWHANWWFWSILISPKSFERQCIIANSKCMEIDTSNGAVLCLKSQVKLKLIKMIFDIGNMVWQRIYYKRSVHFSSIHPSLICIVFWLWLSSHKGNSHFLPSRMCAQAGWSTRKTIKSNTANN